MRFKVRKTQIANAMGIIHVSSTKTVGTQDKRVILALSISTILLVRFDGKFLFNSLSPNQATDASLNKPSAWHKMRGLWLCYELQEYSHEVAIWEASLDIRGRIQIIEQHPQCSSVFVDHEYQAVSHAESVWRSLLWRHHANSWLSESLLPMIRQY